MPEHGNEARANAMAEMDGLLHSLRTDPALKLRLADAEKESLDATRRANLREIRRDWRAANALPAALVEKLTMARARCEHAWRTQRGANDWNGFLANFHDVLNLSREQAKFLGDELG